MARISFRCSDEFLARVDERRGEIPRERFVRGIVARSIGLDGTESWKASAIAEQQTKTEVVGGGRFASAPAGQPEPLAAPESVKRADDLIRSGVVRPATSFVKQHAANCKCPVCR